jgi:hypothetical protein
MRVGEKIEKKGFLKQNERIFKTNVIISRT